MQVHAYLDETGDILTVEIPTTEGNLKTTFNALDLEKSRADAPLVAQMPDVHGSTVFSRPIGEMPLKVQEDYFRQLQAENQAADEQRLAALAQADITTDAAADESGTIQSGTAQPTAEGGKSSPPKEAAGNKPDKSSTTTDYDPGYDSKSGKKK